MKTAKNTFQQGDVIGRKLENKPAGESKVIGKLRCVLADGEHTGHKHVLEDDDATLEMIGEKMILTIMKAGTIVHPEHKPIRVAPGIWEIGRVKEYDWFSKMERQVID